MSAQRSHRMVLTDRCATGRRHRHRWLASCECGAWWGIAARTQDKAAAQFRAHEGKVVHGARPAPVTPEHLLPAALRHVA